MTSLNPADGHLVLINTFVVEPENADRLLTILSEATEDVMRKLPGFVSANLHVSLDRKHVANYAQWRSKADFEAMLANPIAREHMGEAQSVCVSFAPLLYDLKESHGAQ